MPYEVKREELWGRLVSGLLTEVFVFGSVDGSTLGDFLPQTLGLEPISGDAYRYSSSGQLRAPEELAQLARVLSAERCWVAEGRKPEWAEPFMERSQAILYFDLGPSRMKRWDPRFPDRKNVAILEQVATSRFPLKLLRVTTFEQVRLLRKVRPSDQTGP